jgi:hypothetical protein
MTSSGRRWAFFIGLAIAGALPKRVECGYPGGICQVARDREVCKTYELEPLVFYGIEYVIGRDVGFAYSREDDCR